MERAPTCTGKKRLTDTKPVSGQNCTVFACIMTSHSFRTQQHSRRSVCMSGSLQSWTLETLVFNVPFVHQQFGCSVSRLHLNSTCTFFLSLHSATPRFTRTPEDQTGVQGGVASFVCQAAGDPQPKIVWNKKGKKVSNQRFEVHGSLVSLASVVGLYTCCSSQWPSLFESSKCVSEKTKKKQKSEKKKYFDFSAEDKLRVKQMIHAQNFQCLTYSVGLVFRDGCDPTLWLIWESRAPLRQTVFPLPRNCSESWHQSR